MCTSKNLDNYMLRIEVVMCMCVCGLTSDHQIQYSDVKKHLGWSRPWKKDRGRKGKGPKFYPLEILSSKTAMAVKVKGKVRKQ